MNNDKSGNAQQSGMHHSGMHQSGVVTWIDHHL